MGVVWWMDGWVEKGGGGGRGGKQKTDRTWGWCTKHTVSALQGVQVPGLGLI